MTETQWKTLGDYVRDMADVLGLRDWWLFLDHTPSDDDCVASVKVIYGRRNATIRVSTTFMDERLDAQRNSIIHELLHCHTSQIVNCVDHDLHNSGALGTQALDLLMNTMLRTTELAVDAISMSIADRYPMIEWEPAERA